MPGGPSQLPMEAVNSNTSRSILRIRIYLQSEQKEKSHPCGYIVAVSACAFCISSTIGSSMKGNCPNCKEQKHIPKHREAGMCRHVISESTTLFTEDVRGPTGF